MRTKREVPPESQTMGTPSISVVFDKLGYGCGQYGDMVLPYQMNVTVTDAAKHQMSTLCDTKGFAAVRYSLNGGGCSGLIGKWEPETHYEPSEGDMTWSLGEDKVFVIDSTKKSDLPGVKVGKWEIVNQRFITEYTPEGFFFLTFGG